MARQQYYQPKKKPDNDDSIYDEDRQVFGKGSKTESARKTHNASGKALDDIDSALKQNDEFRKNAGLGEDELKKAEETSGNRSGSSDAEQQETDALAIGGNEEGFFKDDKKGGKKGWKKHITRRRAVLGGTAGIFLGGGIGMLMVLLPIFRLEGYLSRIDDKVFGYAQGAVEERVGFLLERYITTRVFASLDTCNKHISKDCARNYSDAGLATNLFNKWRDARFEAKLFDKYGIQIEKFESVESDGSRYRITDRFDRQIRINDGDITRGKWLTNGRGTGSRELGRAIRKNMRNESKWYQVMERRSIRKGLKRKHDLKFWCFLACNQLDELEDKYPKAKTRLKYKMTEQLVYPFSEKVGLYMDCIVSGEAGTGRCSVDSIRERGFEDLSTSDAEDIINEFKENGGEDIDVDSGRRGNKGNRRLTERIIEKVATKIFGPVAGRAAATAIPAAGQIYAAIGLVDMWDRVDTALEDGVVNKYVADLNSKMYASHYSAMRSLNDEMKSNKLSLDEIGAVHDQFAGAEESRIYQALNNNDTATALLGSNKAFAQSEQEDGGYVCADGNPIPSGEYVCDEKKVARPDIANIFETLGTIDDGINTYSQCLLAPGGSDEGPIPFAECGGRASDVIRPVLDAINWAAGELGEAGLAAIRVLPGVDPVISWAENIASTLFDALVRPIFERVFPLVIQPDSPGRELFDGLYAGAEVVSMEFAKGGEGDEGEYGLGAKRISAEEGVAILKQHQEQAEYEHRHSSFYDRYANVSNSRSLMNKVAVSAPSSPTAMASGLLTSIPRAIGNLFNGFGSWSVSAQSGDTLQESPFGLPKYGYPVNDPSLYIDPAELTTERCEEIKEEWENSKTEDPVTGFEEYSKTNPCLLEQVATEAAVSLFTNEDDGGLGSEGSSNVSGTNNQPVVGDTASTPCASGTTDLGEEPDAYSGGNRYRIRLCSIPGFTSASDEDGGTVRVNSTASENWLQLFQAAQSSGVTLSANSSFRSMAKQEYLWNCYQTGSCNNGNLAARPGTSNHQMGLAIDIDIVPGGRDPTLTTCQANPGNYPIYQWLATNASRFGIQATVNSECWHWSPTGN